MMPLLAIVLAVGLTGFARGAGRLSEKEAGDASGQRMNGGESG
jgi:hypothetical protein